MRKASKHAALFAAVLFVLGTLLSGCSNPFIEKPRGNSGGETVGIPEGFGAIRVGFTQGTARSLLPAADLAVLYPEYWFARDGGAAEEKTPEGGLFILEPGSYALEVKVFIDSGHTELAARGNAAFAIASGVYAGQAELVLRPVAEEGEGSLEFNLEFPAGARVETLALTRIAGEESFDLLNPAPKVSGSGPLALSGARPGIPAGYYLLRAALRNGEGASARQVGAVRIRPNLATAASYAFAAGDFQETFRVTNTNDSGTGSLRQAIIDALASGDPSPTIEVELDPGDVIELEDPLPTITANVTIEGAGITLTPVASWTPKTNTQLLIISGSQTNVTIRRVYFKDGRATGMGAAIHSSGTLTLESCIFSGNQVTGNIYNYGGAIYSDYSDLIIRGCTFYNNTASGNGGAVYFSSNYYALTLTGNIFYENSATLYPVAWVNTGSVRASYNVVDVDFGINNTQCGWYKISGDGNVLATNPPVWPVNFELLYKSSAANILPNSLPKDYPTADFYGDAIIGGGAAGAVQSKTADGYYYLELSVNDSNKGTVTPNPQPDPDGFYSAGTPVVITATPSGSYVFGYWLINGAPDPSANPLQISSLTANTSVEAVFVRPVTVDTFTDGPGAATTPGTLRYALTNAGDNDVITFDGVTPGTTTIELESALPNITKSLVIEGAGVTLTPADSWTSRLSSLLFIDGETPTVTIRRVHFKNGACERIGGAIYSEGSLTLESCIFSGNHATGSSATGGAITGTHTLIIRGCTFYANMSDCYAGAVFFAERGNVLTLTGNLFYGNDAVQAFPIVRLDRQASIVPSYNVVDMDFGPGDRFEHYECGWDAGTGDTNLSTLGITGVPFDPTNFVPISDPGLDSVLPSGLTDFPATDFYGTTRTFPGAPGAVAEEPSP